MDSHISEEKLRSKIVTTMYGKKRLDLSGCDLLKLPEALPELTDHELEELYLSRNKLKTIPENVGKLNNITIVDVSGNQLSIFPANLTQLKKLRWLNISHNKLTTIPDAIGEMVEIGILDLSYNQLTVLSPVIKQLKKLKWLNISHNKLTTISDAIGEMVALEGLDLSYNQLTVLSPAITQLKKLQWLFVKGNPFTVEGMRSVVELEDRGIIAQVYSDLQGE